MEYRCEKCGRGKIVLKGNGTILTGKGTQLSCLHCGEKLVKSEK